MAVEKALWQGKWESYLILLLYIWINCTGYLTGLREFDALVAKELQKDNWIIDGNYCRTLETRLQYADLCIFLDYPIELCLQSVYERVKIYQGKTRPDMTNDCVEQVDDEFIEWINNYNENVRPVMLDLLEKTNIPYLIFKSREETQNWLDAISN